MPHAHAQRSQPARVATSCLGGGSCGFPGAACDWRFRRQRRRHTRRRHLDRGIRLRLRLGLGLTIATPPTSAAATIAVSSSRPHFRTAKLSSNCSASSYVTICLPPPPSRDHCLVIDMAGVSRGAFLVCGISLIPGELLASGRSPSRPRMLHWKTRGTWMFDSQAFRSRSGMLHSRLEPVTGATLRKAKAASRRLLRKRYLFSPPIFRIPSWGTFTARFSRFFWRGSAFISAIVTFVRARGA